MLNPKTDNRPRPAHTRASVRFAHHKIRQNLVEKTTCLKEARQFLNFAIRTGFTKHQDAIHRVLQENAQRGPQWIDEQIRDVITGDIDVDSDTGGISELLGSWEKGTSALNTLRHAILELCEAERDFVDAALSYELHMEDHGAEINQKMSFKDHFENFNDRIDAMRASFKNMPDIILMRKRDRDR